ncbi:arginine-binding periplasmic protein-like [Amphiura filiformis]|uniref:arginine-binding periplasmic protein-like n=1 Tax=Amphiura filiformis TaxID=82378 RepID=UPI003B21CCAA
MSNAAEQQKEEPNEEYFRMREELQMNMAQANTSANNKLYLVLMMVTGLAAIVALIISLVVFSSRSGNTCVIGGTSNGMTGTGAVDTKIWNLAIGHLDNNEAYIDDLTGQVKGFHVDIAFEVCKRANKNCRLIWDLYNRCWDSQAGEVTRGGVGLMGGWYDGCVGWAQSYDRSRTFQFSKPFTKSASTYLLVKSNNPRGVDPTDVTGKIIGFIDGYVSDEFCLKRQQGVTGNDLPSTQIRHFDSLQDLIDAIVNGQVDAGFSTFRGDVPDTITLLSDNPFSCYLPNGGVSIMTRLDNGLADWWNPAQDSLIQSSTYRQICSDLKEAHGDQRGNDPSDVCLGM